MHQEREDGIQVCTEYSISNLVELNQIFGGRLILLILEFNVKLNILSASTGNVFA